MGIKVRRIILLVLLAFIILSVWLWIGAQRSLSEDDPKGYLLQPQMALTMQGLVDQVLEADGITKEMVDAERRKIELVNELSQADKETQASLLAENEELIDATFFEVLTAIAQSAGQGGDSRASLRLFNLRKQLLETTEIGQEIQPLHTPDSVRN